MPGNLIKDSLKQPDCIKRFFEKGAKEITGHVTPNQARFGAEYFLAYTLPDFKSKSFAQLSVEQKDNGLLLFNLMGQCFQDVGLTKWTSVIVKQCPDDAD
jgi:hypothetical protein